MNHYEIENQIGRLFHGFYENDLNTICRIFTAAAEIVLPDRQTKYLGERAIRRFWTYEIENRCCNGGNIPTVYMPCEIYIRPKTDEYYRGEWNTYSFRSEQAGKITYFITHMEAEFVLEDEEWRIRKLIWNEVLELVPWKMSSSSNKVSTILSEYAGSAKSCGLTLQDYMEIRNLQGQFTHRGIERSPETFSKCADTRLVLPSILDKAALGFEEVKNAINNIRSIELQNDKNYVFLPFITAPLINKTPNGAKGIWLVLSMEVKASAYGQTTPPFDEIFRVGRFIQEFVKEEGEWKFKSFSHDILFSVDPLPYDPVNAMRHRMREKEWDNTWLSYPEPNRYPCSPDVAEIEMMMPEWTGRIRNGNSMDFVDEHMVNDVEEISFLVAGSTQKRTCGYENIKARFGPRERTGRHENPAYHTLSTPVIQFSENGMRATAVWTDLAMADFSGAFSFPLDPICYHMTADKYYHDFIRVDNEWKLYSFCWEPCIFLGAFPFDATKNRGYYKGWDLTPKGFPVIGESFDYGDIDWKIEK